MTRSKIIGHLLCLSMVQFYSGITLRYDIMIKGSSAVSRSNLAGATLLRCATEFGKHGWIKLTCQNIQILFSFF